MTKTEFIKTCKKAATEDVTLYVLGGYGQDLNEKMPGNKKTWAEYFIAAYGFNRSIDAYGRNRRELILNAKPGTKAYDCNCSIKSFLNGCKGYTTSPCPDISIAALLRKCNNVRKISNTVLPNVGDYLVNSTYGHCGIYLGDGKVFEVTYSGSDGAQITNYAGRGWVWAGDLAPFFDAEPKPIEEVYGVQVMACSTRSNAKKYLRKGQSTYFVDKLYKNAYIFANKGECETALPGIREKYPDAFITKYKAKDLVIL